MKNKPENNKSDYENKTYKSNKKNLFKYIEYTVWGVIIIIVLANIGRLLLKNRYSKVQSKNQTEHTVNPEVTIDWESIDSEMIWSVKQARKRAEEFADLQLTIWADTLKERIDNDFLNWYFSYWNQQILGLKGLFHGAIHLIYKKHPTAAEKLTEEIQRQFANRVLKPSISQLELEEITKETVDTFLVELHKNISKIPQKYNLEKEDWEKYLRHISSTVSYTQGNREIPLGGKIISGILLGSTIELAKALKPFFKKIGSKVFVKITGKTTEKVAVEAGEKIAAKTGGRVAAEMGGKLLGPIVGIGIIIWDLYDHYRTRRINEPILRENLFQYVDLMKKELLTSPDHGVMSPVYQLESEIVEAISNSK